MPIETKPWDAAELLTDDETTAAYLDEAFSSGDAALIAAATGAVARARPADVGNVVKVMRIATGDEPD